MHFSQMFYRPVTEGAMRTLLTRLLDQIARRLETEASNHDEKC